MEGVYYFIPACVHPAYNTFMQAPQAKILRNSICQQRKAVTSEDARVHARSISHRLAKLPCYQRAQRIALYISCAGEVDTKYIVNNAWARGKQLYLPVIRHIRGPELLFAPYNPGSRMKTNCFSIPEPQVSPAKLLKPHQLDIVITPLVAFDVHCGRIGMGGGYYDRSFAFLQQQRRWQHPKLVGIAYELQQIPDCEPEWWDVSLHYVVTENRLYSRPAAKFLFIK